MGQLEVNQSSYRNGWLIGSTVACIIAAGFLVYFRDVHDSLGELLLIGVPIGATIGALVGVGIDPRSLPLRRRVAMSLSIVAGFVSYSIGLILYLGSHV